MKTKAFIDISIFCPECDTEMARGLIGEIQEDRYVMCIIGRCKNYGKKFKAPTVELEEF